MNKPELNDGETYAGAIINPDGTGHHVILLPNYDKKNWNNGMEWAKEQGGDLPDRAELSVLHHTMKEEFQGKAYWSNTQHTSYSGCAWCQSFDHGGQDYYGKLAELLVRAVRRVAI